MTDEELDKARADEAIRINEEADLRLSFRAIAKTAARLAREGWMPPEPVDPDVLFVREVMVEWNAGDHSEVRAWSSGRMDESRDARVALAVLRAERERVAKLEPKPDDEGWIPHDGGPCPVRAFEYVDVRFRGLPEALHKRADCWDWTRSDGLGDIIAWRRA